MADQKDKAQDKKRLEEAGGGDQHDEQTGGVGGGNMGAGKSGKEGMGSEKPSDEEGMGSRKPADSSPQH
ncbi:MAG: hypothetical protein LC800_06865 [Acidobacteria bacterium]|nr:hypothetical protein [Acidobacteriota bacterium]